MIAPHAFIRQVHTFLALPRGAHDAAVDVQDGLGEKVRGLLLPHLGADAIDQVHELLDIGFIETAQEVASGRGVGDALGVESIEVMLVVAEQFDVFQYFAVGEEVIGHVEHMIGLEVGKMFLEEMQFLVDGVRQPQSLDQQVQSADATAGQALRFVGEVIMDIAGFEHRFGLVRPLPRTQAALDTALAIAESVL